MPTNLKLNAQITLRERNMLFVNIVVCSALLAAASAMSLLPWRRPQFRDKRLILQHWFIWWVSSQKSTLISCLRIRAWQDADINRLQLHSRLI